MTDNLLLSVNNDIFEMSIPSMKILPDDNSTSRNNADTSELFPAPVLPTIPVKFDNFFF